MSPAAAAAVAAAAAAAAAATVMVVVVVVVECLGGCLFVLFAFVFVFYLHPRI